MKIENKGIKKVEKINKIEKTGLNKSNLEYLKDKKNIQQQKFIEDKGLFFNTYI